MQQRLVNKKVTMNIFINKLLLFFFINFISHPSDCLDKVDTKFFSQILDMCINNTFVPVEIIFPKAIQKILPGKNAPLIQKQFPQDFKFPLRQFVGFSIYRSGGACYPDTTA